MTQTSYLRVRVRLWVLPNRVVNRVMNQQLQTVLYFKVMTQISYHKVHSTTNMARISEGLSKLVSFRLTATNPGPSLG